MVPPEISLERPLSNAKLSFLNTVKAMPLLQLPVRTSIVQLAGARVMLSPGSRLSADQLRDSGTITDLVATNLLHTAGMPAAAAAFPNARLWGPAGAAQKHPALKWHGVLGVDPWPYEDELWHLSIGGMSKIKESVFLHRESRSLLVSDLAFNIERPVGAGSWVILKVFGTYARFGVSRLFLKYVDDPAAFRASIKTLLVQDFDALIPAHGEIVERGAKEKLIAALKERAQA